MARRILLADDSITIQKVVELTFSEEEYEVLSVNNGQQAIQKLPEWNPDIALLDVIMPEKSGYEVCHEIKQDPKYRSLPVLLLTGTFEPFDAERAERSGADGHITKPFESRALVAKVEELLSGVPSPHEEPGVAAETPEEADSGGGNGKQKVGEEAPDWVAGDFDQESLGSPGSPAEVPPVSSHWASPVEKEPSEGGVVEVTPAPEEPGVELEEPPPPRVEGDLSKTMRIDLPGIAGPPLTSREEVIPEPEGPGGEKDPPSPWKKAEPLGSMESFFPRASTPPPDIPLEMTETKMAPEGFPESPDSRPPAGEVPEESGESGSGMALSPESIDAIAQKVVEKLSDQIVREIAWEVVPDLAETLIRKRIQELEEQAGED